MRILQEQINNNLLSNAYIFEGINESENLSKAYDFAEKIFRKNGINLKKELNPDLFVIDKNLDTIDINTIRDLIKDIYLKPRNDKVKIYIIHHSQNMNKIASNALLKTLEDLKGYNIIIFTTTNKDLLLSTIRSRCQIIRINSEEEKSNIDLEKLSMIISEVYKKNIAVFYENKDFFQNKEEKYEIIDGFLYIFKIIINKKYYGDELECEELSYNIFNLCQLNFDQLEDIVNFISDIRLELKNNVNFDLAIEEIIFNIYNKGR